MNARGQSRNRGVAVATAALMVAGLGLSLATRAYVASPDANGVYLRWALNPTDNRVPSSSVNASTRSIIYRLDAAAWSKTNATAELTAIRAAFDQWQAVPGTVLKFQEGALLNGTQDVNSLDSINSLFWTTRTFVNGGRDNLSGVLALTYVASFSTGNVAVDADTVFNGVEFQWSTDPAETSGTRWSVEATALHEIGHFIGLVHSPVGGATMLAVSDPGANLQFVLSADDIQAARGLYGTAATLAASGAIRGQVTVSGSPVLGAGVFLESARGDVVCGTVTRADGTYLIPGLVPAGGYTLRVAPLDPIATQNYLVRGADISSEYRGANVLFRPGADQTVAVTAGRTSVVDVAVPGGSPLRIVRILRPAADLSSPSFHNKPVTVLPADQVVYLGVATSAALDGTETVSISGDGLSVVGPVQRVANVVGTTTLVAVPVRVASSATPGLRSFRLERSGAVAWAHGYLEIQAPFPDGNFDGLDDRFQRQYWSRFTVPEAAPAADPDGDGFDNRFESMSGSIPTNRLSANFSVESVRVTAGGARVRTQSAKGKRFQLFSRETVPGADWRAVGSAVTAATNFLEFVDAGATNRVKFYRVQMVP